MVDLRDIEIPALRLTESFHLKSDFFERVVKNIKLPSQEVTATFFMHLTIDGFTLLPDLLKMHVALQFSHILRFINPGYVPIFIKIWLDGVQPSRVAYLRTSRLHVGTMTSRDASLLFHDFTQPIGEFDVLGETSMHYRVKTTPESDIVSTSTAVQVQVEHEALTFHIIF